MDNFILGAFWLAIVAVLIVSVSPNVYYVTANSSDDSNNNTLRNYLKNPRKYFTSDSQLFLFPGEYQLDSDLVFEDMKNFTIIGINPCNIYCSSNTSIIVVNVTEFELKNINLINCGKDHTAFGNFTEEKNLTFNKTSYIPNNYNSSIFLYHCATVTITSVNISVNPYIGGIIAMNVKNRFVIDNVKVQLECSNDHKFDNTIHGILLHYKNRGRKGNAKVTLQNFNYRVNGLCIHLSRYAIKVLLLQNKYNVLLTINDTTFHNLNYSGALFYSMTSCKLNAVNSIYINNSTISNNTGDGTHTMFYIKLYKPICATSIHFKIRATKKDSQLFFKNCKFVNNSNMQAMIYIMPPSTSAYAGNITIQNSQFIQNKNIHFIIVKGETENVPWELSTYILLSGINVSSNQHHGGSSLIFITNGVLYLEKKSVFMHNEYYENILMLHVSTIFCDGYSVIERNYVRQIVKATSGSYFIMKIGSTMRIINNTVYNIVTQVHTYEHASQQICPIQFYSPKHNYDYHPDKINVNVSVLYNVHTMSKGLLGSDLTFSNCTWLAGTAFRCINAEDVYKKVFQIKNIIVTKNSTRRIPLSVCPCSNSCSDCYTTNLNPIYPGQTLHVSLIVRKENQKQRNSTITLVVANTPEDDCIITESYQLSQTHFSYGCNNYSYTIWPSHKDITECKLFVGLIGMPEMFFVEIKHCPMGFTLQPIKKSCDCDTALNNIYFSVTSCDLDDETIVRPANSWISSNALNGSYTYIISPYCPFHYCLPYSSNLLLATPDMQCQYERSGILCGHCQDGLSTVFGSSQCKHCSSLYLFIVVPIAIAGVLMVIALFVFNITVNSGSFNTYIFYVNMISINYSSFCPNSYSFYCTPLSLFNLDLGIETCFYNGMDDYGKIWLQLTFPFYLIMIALTLIISSRYSTKVQRLTARRSLQVLATLFLLSYTKLLLAVCQVLFAYSSVMYLPSQHSKTVWSVDASVEIFGIKFCALFFVCIFIFLILLICNFALLFPRTVLRIKFINKFKPLFDPYFGPYKDKYSFWTGLQLLVRAMFYVLTAQLNQDLGTTSGTILLIILLCLQGILQPFKSSFKNIQESLILSNLLMVYVTAALNNDRNRYKNSFVVNVLITAQLAYFIVYIICHSVMTLCGKTVRHRYDQVFNYFTRKHCQSVKHLQKSYSCEIPMVTYNYQEFQDSLIALDN